MECSHLHLECQYKEHRTTLYSSTNFLFLAHKYYNFAEFLEHVIIETVRYFEAFVCKRKKITDKYQFIIFIISAA